MLTIISGTNRINSKTRQVVQNAIEIAKELKIDFKLIDLAELSNDFIHNEQYNSDNWPDWLKTLQENSLIAASHFLIVSPEYNGSFSGYLKLFIDAISVYRFKESIGGKHAALVGVAAGRAGNLRGLDQLTTILHSNGCDVIPGSLPISKINAVMDDNGQLDEATTAILRKLIERLVKT